MTLFEYLSAAFSLVLALGVSRGLNGVRSAFMVNRRYWPHVIWLTTKLLNAVAFWWWLWAYHEADSYWTLLTFMGVLIVPVVIYLQIDSLVGHQPRGVTNWEKHYYSEHKWFFSLNLIQTSVACFLFINIGNPAPVILVGVAWTALAAILSLVCYKSEKHKTHLVIAVLCFSMQMLFLIINVQAPSIFLHAN
jgi:hypothetical protein